WTVEPPRRLAPPRTQRRVRRRKRCLDTLPEARLESPSQIQHAVRWATAPSVLCGAQSISRFRVGKRSSSTEGGWGAVIRAGLRFVAAPEGTESTRLAEGIAELFE